MQKVRSWELWDWKSIRNAVFVVCGLCTGLYFLVHFPDWVRNSRSKEMTFFTDGRFLSSEEVTERSQGITGTRTGIIAYSIRYTYTVNGTPFFSQDKIPTSAENIPFFGRLKADVNRILTIKYNPTDPSASQIDTEN